MGRPGPIQKGKARPKRGKGEGQAPTQKGRIGEEGALFLRENGMASAVLGWVSGCSGVGCDSKEMVTGRRNGAYRLECAFGHMSRHHTRRPCGTPFCPQKPCNTSDQGKFSDFFNKIEPIQPKKGTTGVFLSRKPIFRSSLTLLHCACDLLGNLEHRSSILFHCARQKRSKAANEPPHREAVGRARFPSHAPWCHLSVITPPGTFPATLNIRAAPNGRSSPRCGLFFDLSTQICRHSSHGICSEEDSSFCSKGQKESLWSSPQLTFSHAQ